MRRMARLPSLHHVDTVIATRYGLMLVVKKPASQSRRRKRREFNPWVGKIPWRRAWQPILVFLPGKSHGQRSLVGYSP